tara:strand:+ start:3679 stop:4098 length:420 start_codon:yes stop_codon:yes gene_type:complete
VYGDVKFNYYRYNTPSTIDANQGVPIVVATDKPIVITQLAVFNITNTTIATPTWGIVPAGTERIGGTPHYQMDQIDFFALGNVASAVAGSSVQATVGAGIPSKGFFSKIIVPPGGILVCYFESALNGTIGNTATGYCYA